MQAQRSSIALIRPRPARRRFASPHRVLMLPPTVSDPVRIILAAQIQLRRWRQPQADVTPAVVQRRVREIVAAREALLARGRASLTRRESRGQGVDSCHESRASTGRLTGIQRRRRSAEIVG